jgi:hypothetical protein
MAVKKRAPAKRQGKAPQASLFQRVSTALNPMTYAAKPARQQMEGWNEEYGGGARRRRTDEEVDRAVDGKQRRR